MKLRKTSFACRVFFLLSWWENHHPLNTHGCDHVVITKKNHGVIFWGCPMKGWELKSLSFVGFFQPRIFYDSKNAYILCSFCFYIFVFLSSATKTKVLVTVLVSSVLLMFLEDSLFNYVDLACFWEKWGRHEEGDFCVFSTLRGADLRDLWCMRLLGSQAGLCPGPCLHSGHAARTYCSHSDIQWFCRWGTKQKEVLGVIFALITALCSWPKAEVFSLDFR